MLSRHRQTLRGCLAGLLALCLTTSRVAIAQTTCSDVLLTGALYSGVYTQTGTINDRPLFETMDTLGTWYSLVFLYNPTTTSRRLEAAGGDFEESLSEVDIFPYELAAMGELGVPSEELETMRDRGDVILDACSLGAWYNLEVDSTSASVILFPLHVAFDCSTHPVDITEPWYEAACLSCTLEESSISISCYDTTSEETSTATTSDEESTTTDETTNTSNVDDEGDADDDPEEASDQGDDSGDGDDSDDSSMSMPVIIGIAVAGVLLVVGAIAGTVCYFTRMKRSSANATQHAAQGGAVPHATQVSTAQPVAKSSEGRPAPPSFNATEDTA